MHRAFPAQNQPRRAQGNLGFNVGTIGDRVIGHFQQIAPAVLINRVLQQRIADGQAGFLRHLRHPAKLLFGRIEV